MAEEMAEQTASLSTETAPTRQEISRSAGLRRRTLLLGLAGSALSLGGGAVLLSTQTPADPDAQTALEQARALLSAPPPARETLLKRLTSPQSPADPGALPALVHWLPDLHPESPSPGLKIFNSLSGSRRFPAQVRASWTLHPQGRLGETVLEVTPSGKAIRVLPWAPLFRRAATPCVLAPEPLRQAARCRSLFLWNDSSEEQPLFGNKARKYEWLLPSYAASGVQTLRVVGSFGSNHVLQLALANSIGALRPGGGALEANLELSLYPQPWSASISARLSLARALATTIALEANEAAVAYTVASGTWEEQRARLGGGHSRRAVVPPGGSNALTVLGHVDAMLELALAMRAGQTALAEPPDLLVVALGSGATALGLLLGIRLLGWKTRVLAVASTDRGPLARLVVSGQPRRPFAHGMLRSLAEHTLSWLEQAPFPASLGPLDALLSPLEVDAEAWNPGYGVLSSSARTQVEDAAAQGLLLDPTFTGKAWSALLKRGAAGQLSTQTVLFWHTFNRFPYERLLEP